MKRLGVWARAPLGVAAIGALLLALVAVATNFSGAFGLGSFGSASALDYSAPPLGGFFPLSDPFVDQVLGGPRAPAPPAKVLRGGHLTIRPEVVTHGLTNDAVAQAYPISSIPFTARSDTSRASRESSDPTACSGSGSTVWYRFRSPADATLIASTAAAYPVTLGIFTEPTTATARPIGCNSNDDGLARVVFNVFAGTTYDFQITSRATSGKLEFSLDQPVHPVPVTVPYGGASYDFGYPKISSNGRYVAFVSDSPTLDPRCAVRADGSKPCGDLQVFVHDLETGTNELASVTSTGGVPNNNSVSPWISGDGRYVTFTTNASNVVGTEPPSACCNDQEGDVFRRDRLLNRTERVTVARDGSELSGGDGSISDDGRYVAFWADHEHRTNPAHANYPIEDIYVKDMVTGDVTLASAGNNGERGNHDSIAPQISPDGHYVTFWTRATNLSSGPTPFDDGQNVAGVYQGRVYVYDVRRHHLTFECVPQRAETSGAHCFGPSISEDGRYSLFWSDSDELLPEAPTGGTYTHPTVNLYLRDRSNGRLELINVTDNGTPVGDIGERQFSTVRADRLFRPWVSRDGSVVAFDAAVALTAGDHNGFVDAYVRDRTRGRTIRVSETPEGGEGNDQSVYPYPTGDGSVVAFLSMASNLSGETDHDWDVFVCRWRQT